MTGSTAAPPQWPSHREDARPRGKELLAGPRLGRRPGVCKQGRPGQQAVEDRAAGDAVGVRERAMSQLQCFLTPSNCALTADGAGCLLQTAEARARVSQAREERGLLITAQWVFHKREGGGREDSLVEKPRYLMPHFESRQNALHLRCRTRPLRLVTPCLSGHGRRTSCPPLCRVRTCRGRGRARESVSTRHFLSVQLKPHPQSFPLTRAICSAPSSLRLLEWWTRCPVCTPSPLSFSTKHLYRTKHTQVHQGHWRHPVPWAEHPRVSQGRTLGQPCPPACHSCGKTPCHTPFRPVLGKATQRESMSVTGAGCTYTVSPWPSRPPSPQPQEYTSPVAAKAR